MAQANQSLYVVYFRDPKDNKIVSLKVRKIDDSTLGLGFVRLQDFVFDTDSVVVQPTEIQMQQRLDGVRSLHISIYSIVSVEERGDKRTGLKLKKSRSNLLAFPNEPSENPWKS